jgi:predicted negative regulator of RcsB-dependent stress response
LTTERQHYEESDRLPPEHGHFNGFWPVLLIGLSLIIIFGWEIWVGVETRQTAQQLQDQQEKVVEQSKQVQAGLEKLVRGLVDLAKTDEEAQKLVTKFGIKITNPAVPSETPAQ